MEGGLGLVNNTEDERTSGSATLSLILPQAEHDLRAIPAPIDTFRP